MDDFVPTRCARTKKNVEDNFVAVKYIAHKKKLSKPANDDDRILDSSSNSLFDEKSRSDGEANVDPRKQQELEMKRARWDVIKFGMSGLRSVEAHQAKTAAAVALGARPPKNKSTNYKALKEQRTRVKRAAAKKERVSGADKSLVKRKPKRIRKSQKDSGILGVYGKVQKGVKS